MSRAALVTGASRGLGAALCTQLAAEGWQVLGLSRSGPVQVDLADGAALAAWLATGQLANFVGQATEVLLINNAGTVNPVGPSPALAAADVTAAVHLNVTAALVLTTAVLSARRPGVPATIVHVSSGAGRRPVAEWATYCATKAALDAHAAALAAEQLPGVRVGSIAPGVVDTAMQETLRASDFPDRERFTQLHATGGLTSAAAAAAALLALARRPDFGTQPVCDVRDAARPH
ncbi:SDR family NAD(P)-dependent oxidoreductase [Buchananella hordeovulneris]|uniref:SDR family NAD(P)-dependent oxidoreductase n=1 Tax=Buchananella hordeovulneris TaxID=52770 RepID=UPI000F5E5AA6|nr:SDR family NAD(P)-dependent oxidoreductase [Buchananella hordeovulneris]RRD44933.1 SDR family NAD(P)-dependent oxidoreductase [Buchananella hordeovulneris]